MRILRKSATIVKNLVIWQESVRIKRREIIVSYVARTPTTHLSAMKRCASSATRLVIMPRTAKRRMSFSARNVTMLATNMIDASRNGLSQIKRS